MTERREITLEVGDKEFTFTLTPQDVTKYFNSMTANNKVSPSHNLLVGTVHPVSYTHLTLPTNREV